MSPLVSVSTQYPSCPRCYICVFSVCSIQDEVQTVLTDELSVGSQQNTVGYTLCDVTVGWCWKALWDTGSQTWQLLIRTG